MRLDPAAAPSADRAVSRAHNRGNLLIALIGVFMSGENDLRAHGLCLRRRVGADEVLKMLGFFSSQFDWIGWFGTSQGLSPPKPSLSVRVDPVRDMTTIRSIVGH